MWLIGSLTLWDYILLVSMCVFAYWYWRRRQAVTPAELHRPPSAPRLPPMRKQDMSIEQLRNFNGSETAGGRILVACDGKIFDVSRARHLYGQGEFSTKATVETWAENFKRGRELQDG